MSASRAATSRGSASCPPLSRTARSNSAMRVWMLVGPASRQAVIAASLAAMAALGGESPGRPAGGGVKGSIDAEVFARVGGGVGASPRGGVPSPKRALRTIGR